MLKILLSSARYCYPMKLCVHCCVQAAIIGARLLLGLSRSGAHLEQVYVQALLLDGIAKHSKKISIAANNHAALEDRTLVTRVSNQSVTIEP